MLQRYFRRDYVRVRIRSNPLAPLLEELVVYLADRGHRPLVIQQYVRAAEHFGRWLGRQGLVGDAVTAANVCKFINRHVPRCRCRRPAFCHRATIGPALKHLIHVQSSIGDQKVSKCGTGDPHDTLLDDFDSHMRHTCGLAVTTRSYRLRYARLFLLEKYGLVAPRWGDMTPVDVMGFVNRYAKRCGSGAVQVAASSLRCFLRFAKLRGLLEGDLAQAVPRVANWRLSALPSTVSDDDLQRLLRTFDCSTPIGQRNLATTLCMSELGLRSQEVAGLSLEDVDWRRSALRIGGSKPRRERLVPMTHRLAKAIAAYLRDGRPQTTNRRLFVHHRAPVGARLTPWRISQIVGQAAKQAGIEGVRVGSCILRHTAASRMINKGATLKEIADVLGHRSIDTTAIYAKVNLKALSDVALPWPGREVKR